MELKFTASTKAEAEEYLKVEYKGQKYLLNEFASTFHDKDKEFLLDTLLKDCNIDYKGKVFTYKEMCDDIGLFGDSLPSSSQYFSKIYPIELMHIFVIDRDYYAAGKLVKSAEDQLSYGRYSLLLSHNIIDYNVNTNWITGYGPIYYIRCINANNAIMWYNNVFDSIMQIVFIAYEIYKKHPKYDDKLDYHKMLKLCDYNFLSEFYGSNKAIANFKALWRILADAQNSNNNINQWANYIKHKGGIDYTGVTPDNPMQIKISTVSGETINGTDFDSIQLELDDVIAELKRVHLALYNTIEKLVHFLDFKSVQLIKKDNKLIMPEKAAYKKLILE